MPKFLIERNVPGAGALSEAELHDLSAKSNAVLDDMPDLHWQESYVVDDKVYCVYIAPSEERIKEHARLVGVPADKVSEIRRRIDPTTGED